MRIYDYFWIIPFLFFLFGYLVTQLIFNVNEVKVPYIIGKTLLDGVSILSKQGLNIKLLEEKEENNIKEGIILEQYPKGGSMIRPSASVHIIVSKTSDSKSMPNFIGLDEKAIEELAKMHSIRVKVHKMASNYKKGLCFVQSPIHGKPVIDKANLYISSGSKKLQIVPDFVGFNLLEAQEALINKNIRVDIYHKNVVEDGHSCRDCRVVEQKPMAGSILDITKNFQVQFLVE